MRQLNAEENELLFRIETKPELQPFFFRKVKGLHWFYPLFEKGFFSPEKNPKPLPAKEEGYVSIPIWFAIEYLVASSEELSNPDNLEFADQFMILIREITSHARSHKYSNYWTWWQLAQIIKNIPPRLVRLEDIELIEYWLEDPIQKRRTAKEIGQKWLLKLLDGQDEHSHQLAARLLDILFKIKLNENEIGPFDRKEIILKYNWDAKKITPETSTLSGFKLGLPVVKLFESRLIWIINEQGDDRWSYSWRKVIGEHIQNGDPNDATDIMIAIYRDVLLGFVDRDIETATNYLHSLFESQYQLIKRIVLYTIDMKFSSLQNLIGNILLPEIFNNNYRHELWHLLNNHYPNFSTDQQRKVIDIIEELEAINDEGIVNEKATAHKRLIWLSAIKEFDKQTATLYDKYTSVAKVKLEHPDFSSYFSVGMVDHKSPISLEQLLTLNIDELVATINKDPGRFNEPGLEGLVKCFQDLIKVKENEFYRELMKFIDCDMAFIQSIIEAYRELWRKNEGIPWDDIWPILLNFCHELVKKDNFWSKENAKKRDLFVANRDEVVGEIGQLIEDGTKSDDHAFDKAFLPRAEQTLLILLSKQEGVKFKQDSDAVFVAINSPRGQCIEAMINLSLRSCRLASDKETTGEYQAVWNKYKSVYESELKRSEEGEYEFATLIGMYLPNFLYMSQEWIHNNLANIFDQADYQRWLCTMQGFAYADVKWWVYGEIYNYLKANKDFLKVLDDENLKERVEEKVIQSIIISYIQGKEDLNDPESLISILFSRKDYKELCHFIGFIWTISKEDMDKLQEKVFELWDKLLNILDFNIKEDRKLASQLCHWAVFIDRMDSTTEKWLLKIAPYAEEDYNSDNLLENLARLSESQALEVQKVWLAMLTSYCYPYPEEAIRQIFKNLLLLGLEGDLKAKDIVDAYIELGIDSPRNWLIEIRNSIENTNT